MTEGGLGAQKSGCRHTYEKIRKSQLSQIPIQKGQFVGEVTPQMALRIERNGTVSRASDGNRGFFGVFWMDCCATGGDSGGFRAAKSKPEYAARIMAVLQVNL
jgi:hypothetical protein